jgi:hypothetical protein
VETSTKSDEEHLRLLSIFHYVVAAITALFGCFPIIHVAVGLIFILAPEQFKDDKGGAPPAWFGWVFVGVGSFIIAMFWTLAICVALAGRFLAARKNYMYCLVMAGIECLFSPFGTVLGVFTIVVLMRDSVKQLFAAVSSTASANVGRPSV